MTFDLGTLLRTDELVTEERHPAINLMYLVPTLGREQFGDGALQLGPRLSLQVGVGK
jgi:hypothetical protein